MQTDETEHDNCSEKVDNRIAHTAKAPTSRRQFAMTMAAIAAAPLLPKLGLRHAGPSGAPEPPDPQSQEPDKPLPDADALTEVVRIRYGKNLNDDQLAEVKRSINFRIRGGDRLKQFKLANGDEPAFVFSATPDEAV